MPALFLVLVIIGLLCFVPVILGGAYSERTRCEKMGDTLFFTMGVILLGLATGGAIAWVSL